MAYGSLLADVVKSSSSSPVTFQNTSGTEVGTLCRAWVNFNGTGTVAIRASFNVSSITDNGTGDYTVNFTNAMPDANYSYAPSIGNIPLDCVVTVNSLSTSSIRMYVYRIPTGVTIDASLVSMSIFR